MMNRRIDWQIPSSLMFFLFFACANESSLERDIITDPFPEAQAELREVVNTIAKDAMMANIEGLQEAHLVSDKFTKFGPRNFNRQGVANTNASEAAFFSSISNLNMEIRDLKIDVFGEIGIATYYPHYSFIQDGEDKEGSSRQTLVFVKTRKGWKIIHEHGTPRKGF